MKKIIIKTIILLSLITSIKAQEFEQTLQLYVKEENNQQYLYAKNNYLFDMTYLIKTPQYIKINNTNKIIGVLKAKEYKKIAQIKNERKTNFVTEKIHWVVGDYTLKPQEHYLYSFPLKTGKKTEVLQTHRQTSTHINPHQYAIDLDAKNNKQVYAAREGQVVLVYDTSTEYGSSMKYYKKANKIVIKHEDGTYANYAHLQANTAKVKVGDYVKKGDYLADVGLSGYTVYPHLHFEVSKATKDVVQQSVRLYFKINGIFEDLKMGEKY